DSMALLRSLHLEGKVHGVAPQVVGHVRFADKAAARVAHVDAGTQAQRRSVLHGEALDNAVQFHRELNNAPHVVDAWNRESAARKIALRRRANVLDAELL